MCSQNKEDFKYVQDLVVSVQVVYIGWCVCEKRIFGLIFVDYICILVKLACSLCCYSRLYYNIMCLMY